MDVNRISERPASEVEDLGVLIGESRPGQLHIGFLVKLDDGVARLFHLAWHLRLLEDDPAAELFSNYSWLQSALPDYERRVIAPVIATVKREGQLPISYSPIYSGVYFDQDTLQYRRETPGDGLTCATFILAVMEALGHPILACDTWQARDEDAEWQEGILAFLQEWAEANGMDVKAHVAAIRERADGIRYRPEEVAAGTASDEVPLSYEIATALGAEIVGQLALA